MNREQIDKLLEPRYEVIGEDTSQTFKIGEMFTKAFWDSITWETDRGNVIQNPENYPHLFRKLQWWEHRSLSDMPDHVKSGSTPYLYKSGKWREVSCNPVFTHTGKEETEFWFTDQNGTERIVNYFLPATIEEYNTYINQKQNT